MSKLQSYVLQEVLKAFLLAFIVLLAVMMLGFGIQLLQEGLDIVRLRGLAYYMTIYCTPWVIPSALLTSVIMIFGRLSADKEILAMQVEGMHLWHILYPVYIFALLLSGVNVYLHFYGAPNARFKIENMQSEALLQVLRDRILYSAGRQFLVASYMVSYDNYDNDTLENVRVMQTDSDGALNAIINARRGRLLQPEGQPNMLELVLEEDFTVTHLSGVERGITRATSAKFPMRIGSPPDESEKSIRQMNWREMQRKSSELRDSMKDEGNQSYKHNGNSSDISERIRNKNSQRDELSSVLSRRNSRLTTLKSELQNDREIKENRHIELERLKSDILTLRERKIEHIQTLESLMNGDDADAEERFTKISDTQSSLADLREQIGELRAEKESIEKELKEITAAKTTKKRNIDKLETETQRLSYEISSLSSEISELQQKRRIANIRDDIREIEVRTQRRLTLAFATFMFTVLGVPLGLFSKRHSTLMAFGIGFFVMIAVFYPFMVWGQIMAETGIMHVVPAMWMGNTITFLIGAILTGILFRC